MRGGPGRVDEERRVILVHRRRVQRSLRRDGFAVVDLLGPAQVEACQRAVDDLAVEPDHGFFVTVYDVWGAVARDFDQRLRQVVAPGVARVLPGFEPFLVAATTKGARSPQPVKFHQDWTYTDERTTPTVFAWCPLVDVDEARGCLHVVPGSHRWSDGLRPSRTLEPTEHLQTEFAEHGQAVPLRAGQAVLFYPSTVHGSGPNPSGQHRPAVTIASAPTGSTFVHFHLADDGTVTGYDVDDSFFTTNPYGTAPAGRPRVEPWAPVVAEADFVAKLGPPPR